MRVAVTGASGLLGRRLARSLRDGGHQVVPVTRPGSRSVGGDAIAWDPDRGTIDPRRFAGIDAVVHLAGEGIGDKRWTPEQKERILRSRERGTALLAGALAEAAGGGGGGPRVLLSASGVDYYGDTGDEVVTEAHGPGTGFLAEVCQAWEAATAPAAEAGVRTTFLRTAMVLDPAGGALAKMLPLFKLGLGGRMGPGTQWWSWITAEDWVAAVSFLLDHELEGPVNLSSPGPVPSALFTKALGKALHRPAVLPVPAFGPRLLVGRELADTLLFTSHRVQPSALLDAGFTFAHPDVDTALAAVVSR